MDDLLRTFIMIAEKNSFTKAAAELHLTQSAVSREIQVLEKKYGVLLFERSNRYVRLTKAGEILYTQAKTIVVQYELIKRLMDDLTHTAKGELSIGSGYTFGEYLLPKMIQDFITHYSDIIPKITIKNSRRIVDQVLRHELDIGIIEGSFDTSGLITRSFAKDEMVGIVSPAHPIMDKQEIELFDLRGETWILRERGSGTRDVTDRLFETQGFMPRSTMEFGSSQVIKEAVEAGLGVSLISKWAIRKELQYGILKSFTLKNSPVIRELYYVLPNSRFRTRATDLFIHFITENISSNRTIHE
ncbi:LysR family transcriptional regulator [Ferroacidibacillus organovorans]|uniref:Transcriptional regulator n=1 Tax=Ferroacidibacillus organovorans TaxID=1765683 RepID=A0A117SX47_9BACL|nr:LysR family transcriptional regulator [Ferroacidibacillus organovorans]KUO94791.1 transcriptional regulator [Ferroacidibacillus organovorans]